MTGDGWATSVSAPWLVYTTGASFPSSNRQSELPAVLCHTAYCMSRKAFESTLYDCRSHSKLYNPSFYPALPTTTQK